MCAILDTYNQKVVKDIAPTITTRVSASNEIYVVVADEHKKKDGYPVFPDLIFD